MRVFNCPRCNNSDHFIIVGHVDSNLHVDSDNEQLELETFDEYHEEDSFMTCKVCSHEGSVSDFRERNR